MKPVRRDAVEGLDKFIEGWEHNTYLPHSLRFSGWQMADEAHPAGTGTPGYRVVHKTIRTFVFPQVSMTFSNLQLKFGTGPITWGEPRFQGALNGRTPGTFLLPESGELEVLANNKVSYKWQPNVQINMTAHQEDTPSVNHIEILYALPQEAGDQYEDMIAGGRAGVATLTMMIDRIYGERVLGPVITEEVGEVFEDWHWNRLLGGRSVGMESQARLEQIDGNKFVERLSEVVDGHLHRPDKIRNRIKIASQWYWRAEAEPERVQQYIGYWLCIEALELEENSNIAPIKNRVAELLKVARDTVSVPIGRIYSIRNRLVHGTAREVDVEHVERVRALAVALLEFHGLGLVTPGSGAGLRWAVGLWDAEGSGPAT